MSGVDLSEVLDGFEKTSPSGGGKYVMPGEYIVEVKSCQFKKGHKGISFIGENRVLKVLKRVMETDDTGVERCVSNEVDDEANLVENLTKNKDAGLPNLKAYLLAACDSRYQKKHEAKFVNPKFAEVCAGPAQPLSGILIRVSAFQKANKTNTGFYTVKNWSMMSHEECALHGLEQPAKVAR